MEYIAISRNMSLAAFDNGSASLARFDVSGCLALSNVLQIPFHFTNEIKDSPFDDEIRTIVPFTQQRRK